MANEQNLRPLNTRPERERKEIQRKGAEATNRKRRESKKFSELFESFLNRQCTNEQIKEQLREFGFSDEELTNKNAVIFAQYREALKGSTQASIFIRDTMGEKPIEQVQNINPPQIVIERPKEDKE